MKSMVLMLMFLFAAFTAVVALAMTGCSAEPGAATAVSANYGSPVTAYTVVFNGQGATVEANPAVISNVTIIDSLPTEPQKTGYHFSGWCLGCGCGFMFNAGCSITSNVTVYAIWRADKCTVSFSSPGARILANPVTKTVNYPESTVGTLPTEPVMDGYQFLGWYKTTRYYCERFYTDSPVNSDMTVIAMWSLISNKPPVNPD